MAHKATVFDVRPYTPGEIPLEVRMELMDVAKRNDLSFDYLCAIYRKGHEDMATKAAEEAAGESI